ncbi:MAG: hypothetical protein QXY22_03185 [Candidatus Nitrosotenuis sp.]|uniref:Uncharacterized protein n=1 Tax=Candidatus Nitrosotenuis uzonensis TaxID=1407055 RepID=V6AQS9_9ARCH|nr:hypothetical protein [Candidatus Nitrosotenuis uzonensis]CDI05091.1 conserved hypothetical protein [Candidatus Nitrosotenuis uzonensis]
MLTKRTIIGIGVGSVITAIGLYALILSIGIQTINVDETVDVAKSVTYQFTAPKSSHQNFKVTGERFHVKLQTPADGIQKDEDFKNEITFDWYVLQEGINRIEIKNTGSTELRITGQFSKNTDPLLFTYHIMVITAGIVIIGFSAAFSVRKPKGF